MIGWCDARVSLLSYVVFTSRREKVIQMSAASLWSYWWEFVRKTTHASQLWSLWGTVLLPHAPRGRGKGASFRDEGKFALGYTHSPTTVHNGGVGWRNRAKTSLPLLVVVRGVFSELRTLEAASCAACQNLPRGLSQTNYVQQSRSLSTRVASVSSLGTLRCPRLVTPACTWWSHSEGNGCGSEAAILRERECEKGHKVKLEITNVIGKRPFILKSVMENPFFYFALRIIVKNHFL